MMTEPLSFSKANLRGRDVKCTRCLTGWIAKSKGKTHCGVCKANEIIINQSERTPKDDEYETALRKHHGLE